MKKIFNALIPPTIRNDPLAHWYAKNIIGCALIVTVASPMYALIYYWVGLHSIAYLIAIASIIIIFASATLPVFKSLTFVRSILVTTFYCSMVWVAIVIGGITPAASAWLILPPIIAILFGGLRDGYIWGFICIFTIPTLYFAQDYKHHSFSVSPISNPFFLQAISISGLILIILCLIFFFEKGKKEAALEIQNVNKALRISKEEAERLARKADIANRLKTEFLANMSHELRTPLNAIIGFTELIYTGKSGSVSPEQYEYLGDVLSSAKHLLQLINDILDLSKIESGKMVFHSELVKLKNLTKEVCDILRPQIDKKDITLSIEIDPFVNNISADPRKLKQVFYNYLSNAIKFTPDKGKIDFRIFSFGKEQFKLEVKDTGIGIRKEDLSKLFIEFQQLDASTSKKYPGTGLGLALTRRIVEAQGGFVGVESELGKGSTFFAILPCTPIQ